MSFEKLGPIQGHAAVATCLPSGSRRDNNSLKLIHEFSHLSFIIMKSVYSPQFIYKCKLIC